MIQQKQVGKKPPRIPPSPLLSVSGGSGRNMQSAPFLFPVYLLIMTLEIRRCRAGAALPEPGGESPGGAPRLCAPSGAGRRSGEQHHSCRELHRGSAGWAQHPTRSHAPMLQAMPGRRKHHPGRPGPGGPEAITSAAARAAGSQRQLLRSENKAAPRRSPGTSAH